ncbi:energy-coupling factor transporter transmembrane protein EcfT [Candidatus Woesearchaeota archaeon]|nr:energy-coupling factor transporter transmembrane protein EcfT [Candidatus Woesearchaeota archaeon]
MDPRSKIILLLLLSIYLFAITSSSSFLLLSAFGILLLIITKLPLGYLLKRLFPFLFFFVFILAAHYANILAGLFTIWRFLLLVLFAAVLLWTTTISEMVSALEKLLSPLRFFVSPRDISLMVATAVRFIPLLMHETSQLRDAQKSRGLKKWRFRHVSQLVQGMLKKTFLKAGAIADALDARCYRDKNYTRYTILQISYRDIVAAFVIALVLVIDILKIQYL